MNLYYRSGILTNKDSFLIVNYKGYLALLCNYISFKNPWISLFKNSICLELFKIIIISFKIKRNDIKAKLINKSEIQTNEHKQNI